MVVALLHQLILLALLHSCTGSCYFSAQLQGQFVMQSTTLSNLQQSQVQYSQVNITSDAIPIWGQCHQRNGNNVILMDSFNGAYCIRCFHLKLRSRNILQVHTEGLDKCYTKEELAKANCPDQSKLNHSQEILLYKTKELGGEEIHKEYCPINGKFSFLYNINDGSENKMECSSPTSELDNCPSGSALNLKFRRCSFDNHDITFECLGHWEGNDKQHYLALLDTRVVGELRPLYRCAMYREDSMTGNIYMAFSSDSTCNTDLQSARVGFETLILKIVTSLAWPQQIHSSSCRFPNWTRGHWEHVFVDGNTLIYKDHKTFKTFSLRCIEPAPSSTEKYLIYGRTQCGEEMYSCIWMKSRGMNILEFQFGLASNSYYNSSLCMESNFRDKIWVTQGRLERLQESPCPITGEYTGFIPDAMGLCAKLSSDCRSPEIMYYTVSDCSQQEVYEEREYRCLGQWEEDGLTYTYTQRKDVGTYECFVGSIVSENEIYIKEAGEHCERGVDPLLLGMKLLRKGSCFGKSTIMIPEMVPSHPNPTTPWFINRRPPQSTKPWKPITAPPRRMVEVESDARGSCPTKLFVVLSIILTLAVTFSAQ